MADRALGKDEKEQRRRDIVEVALKLFETRDYSEITMASVAREAELAKGTVYLYFDTKAALFLHVTRRLIADWFDCLDEELSTLSSPLSDPEVIGSTIAATLAEADSLRRILSICHTTIERNIAPDSAAAYKQRLGERLSIMAETLADNVEHFDPESGFHFFLWLYAFVVGIDQLANPPEPVQKAIEARDLHHFDIDFEEQVAAAIAQWLRGLV